MRLFIGIPLPEAAREELAAVATQLRRGGEDLRWSSPEAWHITLQFLGEAGAEQVQCLKMRLAEVLAADFPVQLGALGEFDRAGVLFVDVKAGPELAELQQRVIAATEKCGFVAEDRLFHPHITLARAKGRRRTHSFPAPLPWKENPPQFAPFEAREFLLYESFTGEGGSQYEVLARFALEI